MEEKYLKLNNIKTIDKEYNIYICNNSHVYVRGNFFYIIICKYRNYVENKYGKNNVYYEITPLNDTNIMDHYISLFDKLSKFKYQSRLKNLIFKGSENDLLQILKENNNLIIKDIKQKKDIIQKPNSGTKESHTKTLNALKKTYNIDKITKDDIDTIFKSERNINTKKKYLCAIQYYYRENPNIDDMLKKHITSCITTLAKESNVIQSSNVMTEKDEINLVSWNTILAVKNALGDYVKACPNKYKLYVLLALYTYIPPRRKSDYYNMHYSNNFELVENDKILWVDANKTSEEPIKNALSNDPKNYFGNINGKYYFRFNNHKTAKAYPTQIIEVPDDLKDIILNYITMNKILDGDSLLNMTPSKLEYNIITIFKKYINKHITVNTLRHIYVTDYFINRIHKETIHEQKIIALKMAHSKDLQEKYKKIGNPEIMKIVHPLQQDIHFGKNQQTDAEKKENNLLSIKKYKDKVKNTDDYKQKKALANKKYKEKVKNTENYKLKKAISNKKYNNKKNNTEGNPQKIEAIK